jgi:hypothetical protein
MRKSIHLFNMPLIFAASILLLVFGVPFSWAQSGSTSGWEIPPEIPGEYPGKWYGVYCPDVDRDKLEGMHDGCAFPNQEIISSWGYKAKPIEEIKDLIPEDFYGIASNPQTWGDIRINETEYIPFEKYPGTHIKMRTAATEANKGKASINEKGGLEGYINGIPFPGTEDGPEAAWNFVKARNYGEDAYIQFYSGIVDKKGHTRYSVAETSYMWWGGRLHTNVPEIKPNPNGYDMYNSMGWFSPYDLRGMVMLTHRYNDPEKADDMWLYITSLRRVRRMSTSQRWDKLPGGQDITYDGATGFQGKVVNYDWKYLGQKMLLAGRHANLRMMEIKGKPGGTMADQLFQRVNTKMIEYTPRIVSSVSRAVMWLDPDTWICYYVSMYDKRGRPYLFYAHGWGTDEDGCVSPQGFLVADVQRIHSSNNGVFQLYYHEDAQSKGISPKFYEMNRLKKRYGGR